MIFMRDRGIAVTGLEFHEPSVIRFFEENKLDYDRNDDKGRNNGPYINSFRTNRTKQSIFIFLQFSL